MFCSYITLISSTSHQLTPPTSICTDSTYFTFPCILFRSLPSSTPTHTHPHSHPPTHPHTHTHTHTYVPFHTVPLSSPATQMVFILHLYLHTDFSLYFRFLMHTLDVFISCLQRLFLLVHSTPSKIHPYNLLVHSHHLMHIRITVLQTFPIFCFIFTSILRKLISDH